MMNLIKHKRIHSPVFTIGLGRSVCSNNSKYHNISGGGGGGLLGSIDFGCKACSFLTVIYRVLCLGAPKGFVYLFKPMSCGFTTPGALLKLYAKFL